MVNNLLQNYGDYNWKTFVELGFCNNLVEEEQKYLGDLYTYVAKAYENNEVNVDMLKTYAPQGLNIYWDVTLFATLRDVYLNHKNLNYLTFLDKFYEAVQDSSAFVIMEGQDNEIEYCQKIMNKISDKL